MYVFKKKSANMQITPSKFGRNSFQSYNFTFV